MYIWYIINRYILYYIILYYIYVIMNHRCVYICVKHYTPKSGACNNATPAAAPGWLGAFPLVWVVWTLTSLSHTYIHTYILTVISYGNLDPQRMKAAKGYAGPTWSDRYLGTGSNISLHGSADLGVGAIRQGEGKSCQPPGGNARTHKKLCMQIWLHIQKSQKHSVKIQNKIKFLKEILIFAVL